MLGLTVFLKNNVPGKVKTRIAKDVGDERASEIYERLVAYTHRVATSIPVEKYVYFSEYLDDMVWSPELWTKRVQHGADLGLRMQNAFRGVFTKHKKVVLIGSDCPQLKSQHIIQAYALLKKNDIVLGPSYDGGYYLVAMRKDATSIFEDMEWSHEHVLSHTIERAKQGGFTYTLLEKLHDVDYWTDVQKHCRHIL